ncbi:MAG: FHA domain-containing protein [Planctomycetales bacterium]|nr:FHA domain-containing protein [Planctomycetales bacterium]
MRAKLVVIGGDTKTPEVELRLPAILGRGREATLTLPHPLVSRQHCEIYEQSGQLMVRDLGSLNGTFIANERINEAPLANGQLLTVGTVTFRAVYLSGDGQSESVEPARETTGPADRETIPAPQDLSAEATIPAPTPDGEALPPMASPVHDDQDDDDDDDLSAFFDSLK